MKKILFISHEYRVNGASMSLMNLIKGIQEIYFDSIEIIVLIPWGFGLYKQAENLFKSNGIKFRQMLYRGNYKFVGKKIKIIQRIHAVWNFIAVYRLSHLLTKEKIDIVCSNTSAVDVGARAALAANIKHAYYVREFMEEDHGLEYRNKKRMRRLLEISDYVVFISKAIEKKYKSQYSLKNAIQFFDGFIVGDYYVKNHNILMQSTIKLIQAGGFSDGKGTLKSIEMISLLKKAGIHNVLLEFIGNGKDEYKFKMTEMINKFELQNNVTILPYTTNIKEHLAGADILLMNSQAEGFGRVTVEGMMAGCLILGRNNAGTSELIVHEFNGFLFNDTQEFVNNMKYIAENREKCRTIALHAQEWAAGKFDCKITARKFINFIMR